MTSRATPRLLRALTPVLLSAVPASDRVVVHGWRDGEENALRVAGALTRRCAAQTRITLLCEDPRESRAQLDLALRHTDWDPSRLEIVRKNSPRGYLRFLQARLVLMTHGLFGNPPPGSSRLHVLLGHGHGPKSGQDPRAPLYYSTQLATTNNAVWGHAVISTQIRAASATVSVTGNPRDDAFADDVERERLTALGLRPDARYVLWLPTHRPDRASVAEQLDDSESAKLDALRRLCDEHGIDLVTKAHQLDDQENALAWGMHVVTSESLRDAGLSFFQLLALSSGLISDYSSVWVDYLRTGKPFGLLLPDLARFDAERGFNQPSIPDVAGEAILSDAAAVARFVDEVVRHDGVSPTPLSRRIASRLGLVLEPAATDRVLDVVAAQLARQGLPTLLVPRFERQP